MITYAQAKEKVLRAHPEYAICYDWGSLWSFLPKKNGIGVGTCVLKATGECGPFNYFLETASGISEDPVRLDFASGQPAKAKTKPKTPKPKAAKAKAKK